MGFLSLGSRFVRMRTRISDKFTLPERFKGTVVEKWANYWRGLVTDYAEVSLDVMKGARTNPRRALAIGAGMYGVYQCTQRNPDEEAFLRALRSWSNHMSMIATPLQNPVSASYLREVEQALNHNKLRTFSLGVCTLLWIDLHDKDDCTYPAICKYTQVNYTNFLDHVIDVGFWNHFWRLEWKMRNFDVNYL